MGNKFELGEVVVTKGVYEKMQKDCNFDAFVKTSLGRYSLCDWGDTCKDDIWLNEQAMENNERILAAYEKSNNTIWIITEADRSVTTVLFPDEY